MPEYAAQAEEAFTQARGLFEETLGWLAGSAAVALEHGELEDQLGEQGRELVRLMFQGQLDLRAVREQRRRDVTGPEGAPRTRAENDHGRPLTTVFGEVTVSRIAYRASGVPNVHVLDEELNLPEEKHSHGLRRLAAIEAPRGSYEDAAAALTRAAGAAIGKRQVEELAMRAAADVDAFYAWRRPDPAPQEQVLMLQADGKGITVPILIDFVHVIEYCWKAAWTFFEPGDPDAADWVAGRATAVLDGKATQVATGIRRRATTYSYSQTERKGADTCAAYLDAKAPYLDYPAALANGWPIATGIIEGACRHIIKDRFDITGARWSLGGAEAILKLRALHANGDFSQYWPWHLRRERQRIYGLAA
jgi:hypothetical protein